MARPCPPRVAVVAALRRRGCRAVKPRLGAVWRCAGAVGALPHPRGCPGGETTLGRCVALPQRGWPVGARGCPVI